MNSSFSSRPPGCWADPVPAVCRAGRPAGVAPRRGASSQSKGLEAVGLQGSPLTTGRASPAGPVSGSDQRTSGVTAFRTPSPPPRSAAQAEALDERPVACDVGGLEVAEQPAPAADHLQQAAARVVVVLVDPQVLGELVDAGGEQGHLDLGRAGVALLGRVLRDDLGLVVLDQHAATSFPCDADAA